MKQGKSLVELVQEVTRQNASKKDYIADTRKISFDESARLVGLNGGALALRPVAHGQLAEDFKIPKAFYDRLLAKYPTSLANVVNTLLHSEPEKRMVRVLDGQVRAVLSNRYRKRDNFDLMEAVMPLLMTIEGLRLESCDVTERRLYIKAVFTKLEAKVVGDAVQSGISIENSETGFGKIRVSPYLYILNCLNGAVFNAYGQSSVHIGKEIQVAEDGAFELFSDETMEADDTAFWLKVRDVVKATMQQVTFDKIVSKASEAGVDRLANTVKEVEEVVEITAKKFGYNDQTKEGIMAAMLESGDFTRWGLSNAITFQSQKEEDYDLASDLERDGGKVIELPRTAWTEVLKKAA